MSEINTGWIELDISKLVSAAWNYKTEDEDKQKKLETNIKRNGQVENIIVRDLQNGFFEVVNGNHRLNAFNATGIKKVMTYSLGVVSQGQALRVAIETNETKFASDPLKFSERLKELGEIFAKDDLLETIAVSEEEFDAHLKSLEFDYDTMPNPGASDDKSNDEWETVTLRLPKEVAQQLQYQIDRFKKLLYPEQETDQVALTMPVEAMLQVLAQTEDSHVLG